MVSEDFDIRNFSILQNVQYSGYSTPVLLRLADSTRKAHISLTQVTRGEY